ncbi:MAG: metallophosphoesterase [Labilithrix sp.]
MQREHRRRLVRYGLAVLSALFLLSLVWGFFIEPWTLVVNRVDLPLPKWPKDQPPLEVVLVSDLHVGSPWWSLERTARLVEEINALEPDVVLLAGDYTINGVKLGTRVDIEPIAKVLAGLRAEHGVIAVLGNHDFYNDRARTRRALEQNGIVVLENETKTIVHRGKPVNICGYADMYESYPWPERAFAKAHAGPIVALIHEPDIFERHLPEPAITLAGHTHGGQVRLPLFGRPVVPSDYGQRFAAGHIVEDGKHLFVTTGVGTSIYPVRFRVPPEIALLTLRAE